MFRDGQYLEIIKVSDSCLGAAIVTVQEKTITIKERKVSTNKWLNLEDWAVVYKVLKKALLQNVKNGKAKIEGFEEKMCIAQLEIMYVFENTEQVGDKSAIPTIRVKISPARKRIQKRTLCETNLDVVKSFDKLEQRNNLLSKKTTAKKLKSQTTTNANNLKDIILEEYVPGTPQLKNIVEYVPSKKSTLKAIQMPIDEYTPASLDNKHFIHNISYIPNTVTTLNLDNTYEPTSITVGPDTHSEEYVPNSKNSKYSLEEYQPDFKCKSMKFDDSYVPSNVQFCQKIPSKSLCKVKNIQVRSSQLKSRKCGKESILSQLKDVKKKI